MLPAGSNGLDAAGQVGHGHRGAPVYGSAVTYLSLVVPAAAPDRTLVGYGARVGASGSDGRYLAFQAAHVHRHGTPHGRPVPQLAALVATPAFGAAAGSDSASVTTGRDRPDTAAEADHDRPRTARNQGAVSQLTGAIGSPGLDRPVPVRTQDNPPR